MHTQFNALSVGDFFLKVEDNDGKVYRKVQLHEGKTAAIKLSTRTVSAYIDDESLNVYLIAYDFPVFKMPG